MNSEKEIEIIKPKILILLGINILLSFFHTHNISNWTKNEICLINLKKKVLTLYLNPILVDSN